MPKSAPPPRGTRTAPGALRRNGRRAHEAKFLSAALLQNDPLAAAILEETAEDLAFGLSHVVHLFHPEIIVLGGGLSLVGEPLRAAVERLAPRFIMEAFAPGPRIALARLAEDAVPVGALCLAAERERQFPQRGQSRPVGQPTRVGYGRIGRRQARGAG
jgi:predicted NBD/HSP70 family sugar kinase